MRSYGEGAGEHGEDDVGRRGSGDVVVLRLAAEEEIAHATAGEVGIVAAERRVRMISMAASNWGDVVIALRGCSIRG